MRRALLALTLLPVGQPIAASAAEIITYTLKAKGRLVKIVHSDTVDDGVTAQYTYDKADNQARRHYKIIKSATAVSAFPLGGCSCDERG